MKKYKMEDRFYNLQTALSEIFDIIKTQQQMIDNVEKRIKILEKGK